MPDPNVNRDLDVVSTQDLANLLQLCAAANRGTATERTCLAAARRLSANRRSEAEIGALKGNWENDPCWDIEDTEGFEAHRLELLVYRLERESTVTEGLTQTATELGLTLRGLALLRDLQRRVERLEGVVQP